MNRITGILLLGMGVFAGQGVFSQNVRGHWYGIGRLQVSQTYQDYLSELTLKQNGKNVTGSFQYYFKDSLVNVNVSGSFDLAKRKLRLRPFKMIYYLSPTAQNSIDCYMSGEFDLLVSKTESVLNGLLMSDADHKYTVPNISFRLKRSNDTADWVRHEEPAILPDTTGSKQAVTAAAVSSAAPVQQDTVVSEASQSANAFARREKVFTKEIAVTERRLRIEIYDNGQIDYDSVSLFLNGKMVLPKSKLDHRAIRLTIDLDPTLPYNELSMVAENLGMIPPNTAALVVYDGKTRYETLLSSDLSKTATLKLVTKGGGQ
jgi:archaellum component FlaF (FlaF/FlaG flagellin family)